MKLTKRKAFNFLRSYFDVLNELDNDADKLAFLMAVINKQFLNEEPQLEGLVKFAYISQINAIEKSVKGWQDATGQELTGNYDTPTNTPSGTPMGGPSSTPGSKNKNKRKKKKKNKGNNTPAKAGGFDWSKLLAYINTHTKRNFRTINEPVRTKYRARLKDGYTKQDIMNAVVNATNNPIHKENGYQFLTPEFFSRSSTLDRYAAEVNESEKNKINPYG